MKFKDSMLENFKKIKIYSLYHDFASYFIPMFLFFLYGYYSGHAPIRNIVSMTFDLNLFLQYFIILVALTAFGKVLFEVVHHVLNVLQILYYRLSVLLARRRGWLGNIGSMLNSLIPKLKQEELSPIVLYDFLSRKHVLGVWYSRIRIYAYSLQTALGAVFIAYLLFENQRLILFWFFVVILILAVKARHKLTLSEVELETQIQTSK